MGSLYRSEPMVLSQLFLQPDAAYNCLAELGEVGLVQFQDLNKEVNTFQRNYVREIRRCEEMERKIRFLENEMKKDDIKLDNDGGNPPAPTSREIGDIEAELERLESELKEVNSNYDTMKRSFVDLTEVSHILSKTGNFFNERPGDQAMISADAAAAGVGPAGNLGFTAGVILRDRITSFERMLWRACRGNVLLRHMEIDQPLDNMASETDQHKSVFLVFYQGEQLKIKVKKICEGFHATVYPCPEKQSERDEMRKGVATRIEDIKTVLNQTKEHRLGVLYKAATKLHYWAVKVRKMKAIYHTMNMFSGGSNSVGASSGTRGVGETSQSAPKSLLGVCWCPVRHLEAIRHALQLGVERSGTGSAYILNLVETNEAPPTYNETNKFTSVFQSVIDSYGIATYQEVNPAPFSIISFPFLFSVMFGDAGHGLLVTLAALAMVIFERKLLAQKSTNEIWNIFFGGRYIILLMGFFSIYSGLLYNDIFAKAFNIFGSAWYPSPAAHPQSQIETSPTITLNPAHNTDYVGVPYPFGMDPIWSMSKNAISFLNSFKMKISVIFGISQMLFGVVLSLMNHIYNGDVISICCEFIPQVIFLLCIFGYLIILIFYKWIVYTAATSGCAPSLLIDLINMFLLNYPASPCSVLTFYAGQRSFQTFLLLMVVICIPWLLIPKPLLLRHLHKKKQLIKVTDTTSLISPTDNIEMNSGDSSPTQGRSSHDVVLQEGLYETVDSVSEEKKPKASNSAGHSGAGHGHGGHDEFDFGDIFVHQCIHTIEYCLGCISHTASYLRLWALSLAHAELSEVLWNMVMHTAFTLLGGYAGCIVIFVIFAPWAVLTVAILMLMEGLSAFLHTLRLHWVEFQSKFYKGEGYEFNPYSFKRCLDPNSEEEKSE